MSITSDEVNYLVYRYMMESGFRHSSFTFQHESILDKCDFESYNIQNGLLVNIVQKGIQYMELEAHLNEDGSERECSAPYSIFRPHRCVATPRKSKRSDTSKRDRKEERRAFKEKERDKRTAKKHGETNSEVDQRGDMDRQSNHAMEIDEPEVEVEVNGDQDSLQIDPSCVSCLNGHTSEVFVCAWNPKYTNLLATGAGDSTARIWNLPEGSMNSCRLEEPIVLKHLPSTAYSKDVTTIDWNMNGSFLATGSYDGKARIWTHKGELKHTMDKHLGPIFSLKWNKRGDLLLSGSVDNTAILWDGESGEVRQHFEFHSAPTLDVDWHNDDIFASCSTDGMIHICQIGQTAPIKTFVGHTDEVNAIKWHPSGALLASCSDDTTAKIWSLSQDSYVFDLKNHTKEIYTLKWCPEVSGEKILATASFDTTVRLWDATNGTCLHELANHNEPVYSVAFSPDGKYVASGSFDQSLCIWSVKDGKVIKTYTGNGGIFEVSWNSSGDKLAACFSNNTVVVLDIRM